MKTAVLRPERRSLRSRVHRSSFGRFLESLGEVTDMVRLAARSCVTHPPSFNSVTYEVYQLGVKSFLIVAVASLAVGLVMAIQFGFGLARFGAKLYVPKIVTVSIVRELGPIFAALMISGRVGAGIASEVGSMKVTQQIDAIRALGTDPYQKIVAPKILACVIAAPMLTIMANFLGIFGGLLTSASSLDVSAYDYFFKAFEIVNIRDTMGGLVKSVFFGFTVGTVGCFYGLNTTGGTQGVGRSTTQAVVVSSVVILVLDFVLTKAIWIFEQAFRAGGI